MQSGEVYLSPDSPLWGIPDELRKRLVGLRPSHGLITSYVKLVTKEVPDFIGVTQGYRQ